MRDDVHMTSPSSILLIDAAVHTTAATLFTPAKWCSCARSSSHSWPLPVGGQVAALSTHCSSARRAAVDGTSPGLETLWSCA